MTLSVPSGIAGLLGGGELGLKANGGAGDDVLRVADALSDRPRTWSALNGGIGDDRLWGGTGDDRLDGGGGRDELYGGRGRDRLIGRGSAKDVVDCGSGRDVAIVDRADTVKRCEKVKRR